MRAGGLFWEVGGVIHLPLYTLIRDLEVNL